MSGLPSVQLLFLWASITLGQSHHILVVPHAGGFFSHLQHDKRLGDLLGQAGHRVTYLIHDKHPWRGYLDNDDVILYEFPDNIPLLSDMDWAALAPATIQTVLSVPFLYRDMEVKICNVLLENKILLENLKDTKFDLILVDYFDDCGRILIAYLGVPHLVHKHMGFFLAPDVLYPTLPSFTCVSGGLGCDTDLMSLSERMANFALNVLFNVFKDIVIIRAFDQLRDKHNLNTSDSCAVYSRSVVVVDGDFMIEYPRILMPNIIPISGLSSLRPALSLLDTELVQFIESSAPHGVIVFSLGTLVNQFSSERVEMIARVFGRRKHNVIWRYTGKPPDALPSNTMITRWFPQNDVLAHPLTKVFITHCGMSGLYEAIYNAVPVVAIPMFYDQSHNANLLVHRLKMGVKLNLNTVNEAELEAALVEVIGNASYKNNAKKVSNALHDEAAFYKSIFLNTVESVIKHKGAKHLISEAPHRLNIFQLYSIDVILILLVILFSLLTVVYIFLRIFLKIGCCWKVKKLKLS